MGWVQRILCIYEANDFYYFRSPRWGVAYHPPFGVRRVFMIREFRVCRTNLVKSMHGP